MFLQNIYNNRNKIYIFNRLADGSQQIIEDDKFLPYYFVSHSQGEHKSIYGDKLKKLYVINPSDIRKQASSNAFESDVHFTKQYILDKIPTIEKSRTRWIMYDIEVAVQDEFPNPQEAKYPISTIRAWDNYDNAGYTWTTLTGLTEYEVINGFIQYIQNRTPDLLLAWNQVGFDWPYLCNRYPDFAKDISPIRQSRYITEDIQYPAGIAILDYMALFHKFTLGKRLSYALDNVAQDDLGEESWGDTDFENDLETVVAKCENDVNRMKLLEDKYKVIEFFDSQRLFSRCSWEDLPPKQENYKFQSNNTKLWDVLFLRKGRELGKVLPNKPHYDEGELSRFKADVRRRTDGAYRKLIQSGRFFGVTIYDISGCYPHAITGFNLDPTNLLLHHDMPKYFPSEDVIEASINQGVDSWKNTDWGQYLISNNIVPIPVTYRQAIEELKKNKNYKENFPEDLKPLRGIYYYKQDPTAILPASLKEPLAWKDRLKKELKENWSASKDIEYASAKGLINSNFGATGCPYSRLFRLEVFNTITFLARDLFKYIEAQLVADGYKIIFLDTDSFTVLTTENLTDYLNQLVFMWGVDKYNNANTGIEFDFKGTFEAIYVGSNCRYVGYLNNGKEIKREVKGVESLRRDSSVYVKKFTSELIDLILKKESTKQNIIDYIIAEIKNIHQVPLLELSVPCCIQKPLDQYKVKTITIRALRASKLTKKIGERFWYTFVNNPENNVLAIDANNVPNVDQIDWNALVDRNIFKKIQNIFEALGWQEDYLKLCKEFGNQHTRAEIKELLQHIENNEELVEYYAPPKKPRKSKKSIDTNEKV